MHSPAVHPQINHGYHPQNAVNNLPNQRQQHRPLPHDSRRRRKLSSVIIGLIFLVIVVIILVSVLTRDNSSKSASENLNSTRKTTTTNTGHTTTVIYPTRTDPLDGNSTTTTANPSEIHDGNVSEISTQERESIRVATATRPSMINKLTSEVIVETNNT